jgi:hypothetical protein
MIRAVPQFHNVELLTRTATALVVKSQKRRSCHGNVKYALDAYYSNHSQARLPTHRGQALKFKTHALILSIFSAQAKMSVYFQLRFLRTNHHPSKIHHYVSADTVTDSVDHDETSEISILNLIERHTVDLSKTERR